jgi:N-acetylglucosamine kinase-like BadF-type ATPase
MSYYLGVDAGGSKTYTLIADEHGNIVGAGRSGNGNHQTGAERAERHIRESVEGALGQAGLTREEIAFAYFGLAGADREADFRILRPMIARLGFARHAIACDTMIALRAGTDRRCGVVLICGTGTNSAGVNLQGDFYQCGGFSYLHGDFGGGASLSEEAFRTVVRAWDGREGPTLLTRLVLDDLGYDSVEAMFNDYLDHHRSPPARLAKLLFQAAGRDDEAAKDILRRQGIELGKAAQAVIERLGMAEESFEVVLAGSILTRGEGDFVLRYIREAVQGAAPGASLVRLEDEPVVGALWLAAESDGATLTRKFRERLRAHSGTSFN